MILVFPDAATLRLALTSGVVPAEVAVSPAAVSFDAGRVAVETDAKLPKKAADELKRLGVVAARKHPVTPEPVSCWPQAVPVEKTTGSPELSSQAAVLFELPSAADLATFAAEMLRLGNDRQSFRWVADGEADPRVLLRVVGPPHYTLLRALDRPAGSEVRAYAEQAPRLWVEVGHSHPLAGRVAVPEGQLLLVRPPRDWRFVADAPFRDIYDAAQFPLPAAPKPWADAPVESKLTVALKLAPGNAADAPELWVLRGQEADQFDTFVRDADDRTLDRLKFAVGTDAAGGRVVVVRTASAKQPAPVMPLAGAVGYKPFWKLPNLYVPAGSRLHPQLRRDVVRRILADDADRLVWLAPGPNGTFTPETLPEDSFRPLAEWVEYVVKAEQAPLAAWVEASRFDFERFVCSETATPKAKDDKGPPKARSTPKGKGSDAPPPAPAAPIPVGTPEDVAAAEPVALAPVEVKPPSEWAVRRQELEDRFLAAEGPLDSPERLTLWSDLATASAGAGDQTEAGISWANALWEQPTPPAAWLDAWLRAELPDLPRPVPAAEFDRRMAAPDPTPGEARQFAALLLAVAYQPTPPDWLRGRLPAAQRYLEAQEGKLPVRLAWLAAYRLAQLTGADILGLARVRDRLLQRLLEEGLNPERNLPHFLRYAGSKDAARVRLVREKALELHRLVRAWAAAGLKSPSALTQSEHGATLGYIDLIFGYGLAKLGEATDAKGLAESARRVLVPDGSLAAEPQDKAGGTTTEARRIVSGFLFRAYQFRVDQASSGRANTGRLSPELYDALDAIDRRAEGVANSPGGMAHYNISRLRQQSRILEPLETLEPYHKFMKHGDNLRAALSDLGAIREPARLARAVQNLYRNGVGTGATAQGRFVTLLESLPLAGRVGEAFTVELLGLVPEAMKGVESSPAAAAGTVSELPEKQGRLFARALMLAAHYDRADLVRGLADRFVRLIATKPDDQRYELVNAAAGQSLRSLRKLGLRDEVDQLLRRLQDEVLRGQTPGQFRLKTRPELWGKALQSLLHLAGGWLTFGLVAQADPILDDARAELLTAGPSKLQMADFVKVLQAYVSAVGQGPPETGLARLVELFRQMRPGLVLNGYTSAPYYSRLHLNVAEEVVLALTSDDFALGAAGHRWLEEDEYLIRRRIHRDVKRNLDHGGL